MIVTGVARARRIMRVVATDSARRNSVEIRSTEGKAENCSAELWT